jgi:zinc transport system substrate-binding protein
MTTRRSILASLATLAVFAIGAPIPVHAEEKPMEITVTILPMKPMVEAIGGEHVAVSALVPQGTHPRTFEPTPKQMAALNSSALYINMGIPHEQNWLPQVKAARPDMPILNFIDNVEIRQKDGKEVIDPHIWLGPQQLRAMAGSLRDTLTELAPQHGDDFVANTAAWIAKLDAADADAKVRLAPHVGKAILVFHPAFGYLTDAYGIRQLAIENQGMEPGPRRIASSIEAARANKIKTIFVQSSYSLDEAKTIAAEIDGELVTLNPLAPDLIKNLTVVTTAIEASFK